MEARETDAMPAATEPTRSASAASTDAPTSTSVQRGVRSGEICVRTRAEALCAADGAVYGLASGIRSLVMEPPTLQQLMAPWESTTKSLKQGRLAVRERRRLVRERHEAARGALSTQSVTGESLQATLDATAQKSALASASTQYTAAYHALEQLHAQHAMRAAMEHYALLEQERAWIAAWQQREFESCQELTRTTKRRHHLTSFAVHLESETSGQIRLWRLQDGDAQRARCVKAATENIKKGFFRVVDSARVDVTDVYKIENKPLLRAFERWVDASTAAASSSSSSSTDLKVKGLFCCVPTESLEHCVVWGMHSDEHELVRHAGIADQQVFNRPCATQGERAGKRDAPGTERRFVALQRVMDASAMQFPRRFSRYSTLNEQRDSVAKDLDMRGAPVRYLALCRVAMGKIQRVTSGMIDFPANSAVGSQYHPEDEEYVVRHPQAIVPEFLVEYRFARLTSEEGGGADVSAEDRIIAIDLATHQLDRVTLPVTLFQSAAHQLASKGVESSIPCSLFPANQSTQSMFGKGQHAPTHGIRGDAKEKSTTEIALERSGRRRHVQLEGIQQMRSILWTQTQTVWSRLDVSIREKRSEKDQGVIQTRNQEMNDQEEFIPPPKKQSIKAKKLYGELALVRQLQERDASKHHELLDRLKKTKPSNNSESNKPRPFR